MAGYIKLYRKITEWEWYTEVNTCKLFIHLLIKANHTENKWRGQTIKEGSFITSLESLASETGLTVSQVRTALNNLKKSGDIEKKSSNKNTFIEIVNYERYQSVYDTQNDTQNDTPFDKQNSKQIANESQSNDKQIATNKNEKNDKNDKEINNRGRFTPPKLEEVSLYCQERGNKIDPQAFIDYYDSVNWFVGKKKMTDWKACVRTWERRNKKTDSSKVERTLPSWYQNEQQDFEEASEEDLAEFEKMLGELNNE